MEIGMKIRTEQSVQHSSLFLGIALTINSPR
jgi:hypothetical protein